MESSNQAEFSPESVEVRVARGAEWLDKTRPGWERKIDLAVLDISNGCRCILGQVLGAYHLWWEATLCQETHDFDWPVNHGFKCHIIPEYSKLDEAWVGLIKERFDSGLLSD